MPSAAAGRRKRAERSFCFFFFQEKEGGRKLPFDTNGRESCLKKLTTALTALAAAAMLALPALAAPEEAEILDNPETPGDYVVGDYGLTDTGYSGPLDPRTGLPPDLAPGEKVLEGAQYSYDSQARCYRNPVGDRSFTSNIPNGAVLSKGQTVSVIVPSGLSATVYRGGDAAEDLDPANLTQVGSYLLEVRGAGAESVSFTFQILPELTGSLRELALPEGFTFEQVTLNGEALRPEYANYMELLEDGEYEVRWSCPDIGESYRLSFTLDTQPPVLALPEVVNGEAHGPVTVADLEEDAYILIEQDGEESTIVSPSTVIRDAGRYVLTVYDQAGNHTRYEFIIHMYLNVSAIAALGMLLALAAGLFGYSRYIKKHPRVG